MHIVSVLRALRPSQRNAVLSSNLGWTLDAFDWARSARCAFRLGRPGIWGSLGGVTQRSGPKCYALS